MRNQVQMRATKREQTAAEKAEQSSAVLPEQECPVAHSRKPHAEPLFKEREDVLAALSQHHARQLLVAQYDGLLAQSTRVQELAISSARRHAVTVERVVQRRSS